MSITRLVNNCLLVHDIDIFLIDYLQAATYTRLILVSGALRKGSILVPIFCFPPTNLLIVTILITGILLLSLLCSPIISTSEVFISVLSRFLVAFALISTLLLKELLHMQIFRRWFNPFECIPHVVGLLDFFPLVARPLVTLFPTLSVR